MFFLNRVESRSYLSRYNENNGQGEADEQEKEEAAKEEVLLSKEKEEQDLDSEAFQNILEQMEKEWYNAAEDLRLFVEAETISQVKAIVGHIKQKKAELESSSMEEAQKIEFLNRMKKIKKKCDMKICRLKLEAELVRRVERAKEKKEDAKAEKLSEQYQREKGLRKAEEYIQLQKTVKKVRKNPNRKTFSTYNENSKVKDVLKELTAAGNFIDVKSEDMEAGKEEATNVKLLL